VQRVKFVQDSIIDCLEPIGTAQARELILKYIERDSEELEELQRIRRLGRPPGTRELLLQQKREASEREFEAGYWIPDITDAATLESIKKWNGQWVALNTMRFIRITKDGERKDSSFPPKGNS
jgi:translation machinery-associated protein 16